MERVVRIRMRVQSPVECVMNSMGLAPRALWRAFHTRRSSGISAARKIAIFVRRKVISGCKSLDFVIPSEARDLHFAANCRSLASLGRTIPEKVSEILNYKIPRLPNYKETAELRSAWTDECVRPYTS